MLLKELMNNPTQQQAYSQDYQDRSQNGMRPADQQTQNKATTSVEQLAMDATQNSDQWLGSDFDMSNVQELVQTKLGNFLKRHPAYADENNQQFMKNNFNAIVEQVVAALHRYAKNR